MFKLSIIILNFNTPKLTINLIKSIESKYKQELDENKFEIIIVDNASSDNSIDEIKKLKNLVSNINLIISKSNLGFGNGCNLGAGSAKGEYLLFLNSDTEINDRGLIDMVEFASNNSNVGIIGGKLKNSDGSNQNSAGNEYNLLNVFLILLGLERFGLLRKSPQEIEKVAWVSGACLMINKNIFEKIGGFEKEIFMYMEDVEICYRAKKYGYATYFFPNIDLIHKERGSSNRAFAILNIYKGLIFFFRKYKPYWQFVFVKNLLKFKAGFYSTIGKIIGNNYLYSTYKEALTIIK